MVEDPAERANEDEPDSSVLEAAVRRVLAESHRDLAGFLRRRLGNRDDADDVLQKFVLKALRHSHGLRDVRTVRGWLGRVLATTIIDHQRAAATRRRREEVMDPLDLANRAEALFDPDPETDQVVCQCLYKLLPTLKPEYADVIWRADLLGEPRDQLAISLGTTLNNATVRLHRARQALKLRLEQMCRICVTHGFLDCQCNDEKLQSRPADDR